MCGVFVAFLFSPLNPSKAVRNKWRHSEVISSLATQLFVMFKKWGFKQFWENDTVHKYSLALSSFFCMIKTCEQYSNAFAEHTTTIISSSITPSSLKSFKSFPRRISFCLGNFCNTWPANPYPLPWISLMSITAESVFLPQIFQGALWMVIHLRNWLKRWKSCICLS